MITDPDLRPIWDGLADAADEAERALALDCAFRASRPVPGSSRRRVRYRRTVRRWSVGSASRQDRWRLAAYDGHVCRPYVVLKPGCQVGWRSRGARPVTPRLGRTAPMLGATRGLSGDD